MESNPPPPVTEEVPPRLADDVKEVLRKSEQLSDALQTLQSTNHSLKFYSNKLLVKLKELKSLATKPQHESVRYATSERELMR